MSGLSRTPGKRVQVHSLTGVRIPPSPPQLLCKSLILKDFDFLDQLLSHTSTHPCGLMKLEFSSSGVAAFETP